MLGLLLDREAAERFANILLKAAELLRLAGARRKDKETWLYVADQLETVANALLSEDNVLNRLQLLILTLVRLVSKLRGQNTEVVVETLK